MRVTGRAGQVRSGQEEWEGRERGKGRTGGKEGKGMEEERKGIGGYGKTDTINKNKKGIKVKEKETLKMERIKKGKR